MLFTENEEWFQQLGQAIGIRSTSSIVSSMAEWFVAGGVYHAYYMWPAVILFRDVTHCGISSNNSEIPQL